MVEKWKSAVLSPETTLFTHLPLTGYIRMVSKREARNVRLNGYFYGGEFFEVRAGRLPDVAYMSAFENAQGQNDTPDSILFFPKRCVAACHIDHRHPNYDQPYPAIASTAILSHKFSPGDCVDVMREVKRRVKKAGISSLEDQQQFATLSRQQLITDKGKVINTINLSSGDIFTPLIQLINRLKTK